MTIHRQASLKALLATAAFAATAGASTFAFAGEPATQNGAPVTITASRPTATEAAYVNTLFEQLNRAKRYPTGREASLTRPDGTAVVWVEVARDGRVVARGLESTSYSMLLDDMAVALVGRNDYAALPADGWTDGTTHRFRVAYQFSGAPSSSDEPARVAVLPR